MKSVRPYKIFFCILAAVSIFATCNDKGKRKMPQMTPLYMYRDKQPMGTNMAYRLLQHEFTVGTSLASKRMNALVNEFAYMEGTAYISIGKNVNLGDDELGQLLNYVHKGNEFFISASNISRRLLDTLGVSSMYMEVAADEEADEAGLTKKKNTALQIADTITYGNKRYGFYYYPFRSVFTDYDSSVTTVLGVNESGHPNYLVVRYGKGKFYLHTAPAAFSNYFLLTAQNTEYYKQVFSYLNENASQVFWADTDRFGKPSDDFSALAIFWKNPPLKYALLLGSLLILLYIAFSSKRKRRLVPQAIPNNNDSISFVHTIGNLYLQKKDNRNIAIKMMTYFLEHVRSNYYISTNNINTEFIQALSRKSGVEESKVKALMEQAAYINEAESITDQELFAMNNLIYEFYKR